MTLNPDNKSLDMFHQRPEEIILCKNILYAGQNFLKLSECI